MIRDLLDSVAGRLGYIPKAEFDDIIEVYARRILELGDEIDALKRRIVNLTGMLAAADDDRDKAVSAVLVDLRIECARRSKAEDDLRTLAEAADVFIIRDAAEDI